MKNLLEIKFGSVLIFLALVVAVWGLFPLVAYLLMAMEKLLFWLFFLFMPEAVREFSGFGQIGVGLLYSVLGILGAAMIDKIRR